MKVRILSRSGGEKLLQESFPDAMAVISFHGPEKAPVEYGAAQRVLYIPLDDFQPSLPQAEEIARFIYAVRVEGLDILCQCESGHSRSAGCAAAILEHFAGRGAVVFDKEGLSPDQMVYDTILTALDSVSKEK